MKDNISDSGTGYSRWSLLVTGFILSLSIGFLDVAISILGFPSRLSSFVSILAPVAATVIFVFLVFAVLWFLVLTHFIRFFKAGSLPLSIALALFIGTFFLIYNMVHLSLDPNNFLRILILTCISFLVAAGSYFAVDVVKKSVKPWRAILVGSFALPVLLAETMILAWLHIYRVGAFLSLASFVVTSCYVITAGLTLVIFYRIGEVKKLKGIITIFMFIVLLSPLTHLVSARAPAYPSSSFTNKNHKIKHVVLLVIDTLRPDVLSCYGSKDISTPDIDRVADDGILFSKAMATSSWTVPSVATIMTGLCPSVHWAIRLESRLSDSLQTLAEFMRDAGYFTGAIGKNPILAPAHNFTQGFYDYDFFPKAPIGTSFGEVILKELFPAKYRVHATTSDLTDLSIEWIEKNRDKDFFLWLHYFDPHLPYAPPEEYQPAMARPPGMERVFSLKSISPRIPIDFVKGEDQRVWTKALYEGEVRYVDHDVGRIIAALKRLNLYDETLIVLTSDHGEEFWEHDGFEHGHTLYNELLHVPLIVKLPHGSSKGRVDSTVATAGILPTILELCRIRYNPEYLSSGSLCPLWGPHPQSFKEEPIVGTGLLFRAERESLIFGGFKYIHSLVSGHEELYDLINDPGEKHSVVYLYPDKVAEARNILKAHNKRSEKLRKRYHISTEGLQLDRETIERLQALGYI